MRAEVFSVRLGMLAPGVSDFVAADGMTVRTRERNVAGAPTL